MRVAFSVVLLAGLAVSGSAHAGYLPAWYQGPSGYERAKSEQAASGAPMLVYFGTDWCPHCRELETGLLSHDATTEVLEPLPKVQINPEKNRASAHLGRQYRVRGYPSLFLVTADGKTTKLSVHRKSAGGSRLMTAAELRSYVEQVSGWSGGQPSGGPAEETEEPEEPDISEAIARIQESGDHAQALETLNASIEKEPSNARLYYQRGVSRKELRKIRDARRDFEVAIALDGDLHEARLALGELYVELQMWDDALRQLARLIDAHPSGRAYFLRAVAYKGTGLPDRARDDFAAACNLGNKDACNRL